MQLLESAGIQHIVNEYITTVQKWIPIFQVQKLEEASSRPTWESGPEFALLFLAMNLITTQYHDSVDINQNPVYQATKRFVSLLEAAGAASLIILQANLLVAWYEYGQAIYPAAYITSGWCVRYGNLLGINGHVEATQLLPSQVSLCM